MLPLPVPQLFFLMLLLVVDGEPFRFFLLRRLKFVSDLDLIQIILLDIYLGGFFLYVVAMLPLQLFSWTIVVGVTVVCLFLSIAIHARASKRLFSLSKIRASLTQNQKVSLEYLAVFAMFMIFLLINLASASGSVLGSVHDESIHSLTVEVILENKQVPLTLQPYLAEGIIYPQASHVIFAFATYVLNMEVPEAVFYVSILFKSLTILGAYFLGKKLSSRRAYYLGLTFVFTFVSSWPLYVTWGGNPFLVGFPLFLLTLGLLFQMVRNHEGSSPAELVAIGLLFGYSAALIVSYLETLIATALLIGVYWLIGKNKRLRGHLFELLVVFLVSLLPLSPFLYRFLLFYGYPGHNIGIPSDFSGLPQAQFYATQALQWILQNLSPYTWVSIFILSLLAGFAVLIWKTREYKDVASQTAFALAVFAASALLSIVSFFLPAGFNVISWGHQGVIMNVPISVLIVTLYIKLYELCRRSKIKPLEKVFSKNVYSGTLLALIVLLAINAPFLGSRLVMDPQTLKGAYALYAVANETDYKLMLWMKANLTSAAVILVNPNDAGLFIPAISHQKIIFPWTASSYALSFETLANLTLGHVLNDTTYALMKEYNITHVFVGANATNWWTGNFTWDPNLFIGNPNFKLVKNFGNSYLFQFNYTRPYVVFSDDFEHENWDDYGWQAYSDGNGVGNVTIGYDLGNQSRCLEITSQAAYNVSTWKYAQYVAREIFVQNNSDVNLSFRLNATEGFHAPDTFAILISNLYHNQSLIITTPNSVFQRYSHAQVLNGSVGTYEFKGSTSLTSLWYQNYHSTLPTTLVMELVNYDFDGIQNVAYIGDITVTSTPFPSS